VNGGAPAYRLDAVANLLTMPPANFPYLTQSGSGDPLATFAFRESLADRASKTAGGRGSTKAARFFGIAAMLLLVYAALGPAKWQLRFGLGPLIEHTLALFAIASIACAAWPRPILVGGAFMTAAPLLEVMQGLTPDRVPDLPTAACGAGGALAAALLAELSMRVRKWMRESGTSQAGEAHGREKQ